MLPQLILELVWPQVPQSPAYQIYATIVAFYLPLSVILILNAKIYITARRIITKVRMVSYRILAS